MKHRTVVIRSENNTDPKKNLHPQPKRKHRIKRFAASSICILSGYMPPPVSTARFDPILPEEQQADPKDDYNSLLKIIPNRSLVFSGPEDGPFSAKQNTFTLENLSTTDSVNWQATPSHSWVNAAPSSGTLSTSLSTNLTVSISSSAPSLSAGHYRATIDFSNTSNDYVQTRDIDLWVVAPPIIPCSPIPENFSTNIPVDKWLIWDLKTASNLMSDNKTSLAPPKAADKIYWTDVVSNKLERANIDGSERFLTLIHTNIIACAYETNYKEFYYSDNTKLYRASENFIHINELFTDRHSILDISFDSKNRKIYWAEWSRGIFCSNLDGTELQVIKQND
ncbi:MAG TPA: hypothetical protein VIR63_06000, partial [Pontiella sp.]